MSGTKREDVEPELTYEEFCDSPMCQRCNTFMDLNPGCDWPEDRRLWICDHCASLALGETLEELADTQRMAAGMRSALEKCATDLIRCRSWMANKMRKDRLPASNCRIITDSDKSIEAANDALGVRG